MKRLSLAITMVTVLASAAAANWDFRDVSTPDMNWENATSPTYSPRASCVAWGDVNNDGRPDLFAGSSSISGSRLYINDGDNFVDQTESYNLQTLNNVRSAQLVDYDRDGLIDLLCMTTNENSVEVYRQTEDARFAPVGIELESEDHIVEAALWDDLDGDGQLDLMISSAGNGLPHLSALINSGNSFSLARASALPEGLENATQLSMVDFDADGDRDLIVGSDSDAQVLKNENGTYADIRADLNLPENLAAYGIAWADFNQDGLLDFVTCGPSDYTYLYLARLENGEIVYEERFRTDPRLAPHFPFCHDGTSVHTVDANRDGWMDIFFVGSDHGQNYLLLNNIGETWYHSATARALSLPGESNTACAWADFDNDGDLDVAIARDDEGVKLMLNNQDSRREYFKLRLVDRTSEIQLTNCQIYAKFDEGRAWSTTSMATSAIGSDCNECIFVNPYETHSRNIEVHVIWPDGRRSAHTIDELNLYGIVGLRSPRSTHDPITEDLLAPEPELDATLSNNPNPFNPTTSLNYGVPVAGNITLSVYNLLGQEVANLVNGYSEVGFHTVTFDASALPSGLYIARLQTATTTQLHRMILTK